MQQPTSEAKLADAIKELTTAYEPFSKYITSCVRYVAMLHDHEQQELVVSERMSLRADARKHLEHCLDGILMLLRGSVYSLLDAKDLHMTSPNVQTLLQKQVELHVTMSTVLSKLRSLDS
jgi:hypothetical protein